MKSWIILAAIVGLSQARPEFSNTILDPNADSQSRDSVIEQLLISALEDLRQGMLTGSESYPVLDPYVTDSFTLDGSNYGFPQASIEFLDLTFRNLSTFVVQDASINLISLFAQRYRITLDIVVPELIAEAGHYDLKLQANDFDITGEGPATLTLKEGRIYGTIIARIRVGLGGVSINIESTDLKLGLGGFEPNFQNLFNDPGASIFANTFLKHLVPDLVELYEPEISAFINSLLPNALNGFITELRAAKNSRD
ncbi:unnamed protein product [Plutella xylostella]|uniref:(diamondback moth) hypothetical protein n=1 Tax=Plutella xylostella TaxID=51655 RepID=A0A8S4E6D3_PLUXY|nr:uncharacterized protein LOC105386749 [Plutella xylostella]CAG9110925.1 unnamed protein product [Plutella xylostella]